MRSAFAYRPTRGPLQTASALAAVAYLGAFAVVAFVFSNPIVLAGAGAAVCVAGLAAGARTALAAAARYGAPLALAIVAINVLVTQRGETTLVRGWDLPVIGTTDITLESLAAGGVLALRILVVIAAFAVYSACVDPDRILRLLRPLARRSVLTATLVSRAVPLAAADFTRLRDAAKLRGPAAAPATRAAIARRLLTGSLDRSVDAAATLELRGFASAGRLRPGPRHRSRHDRHFLAAAFATLVAASVAFVTGIAGFDPYPALTLDSGVWTIGFALALPIVAAAPFSRLPRRSAARAPAPVEAARA
jgi:energy-coupling factor transport system permease protein